MAKINWLSQSCLSVLLNRFTSVLCCGLTGSINCPVFLSLRNSGGAHPPLDGPERGRDTHSVIQHSIFSAEASRFFGMNCCLARSLANCMRSRAVRRPSTCGMRLEGPRVSEEVEFKRESVAAVAQDAAAVMESTPSKASHTTTGMQTRSV